MLYEVQVIVRVSADSESEAYRFIRHALDHAKKAEITVADQEVITTYEEDEEERRADDEYFRTGTRYPGQ